MGMSVEFRWVSATSSVCVCVYVCDEYSLAMQKSNSLRREEREGVTSVCAVWLQRHSTSATVKWGHKILSGIISKFFIEILFHFLEELSS